MRATEFITEEAKAVKYNGLTLKYAFNDNALIMKAFEQGSPIAFVKFVKEGKELYPQNLWVNDDYRNKGIAKSMYDYLKSAGYIINRSHDQTKAGSGFWDKHRGEDSYVWESSNQLTFDAEPYEGWTGEGLIVKAYDGEDEVGHVIFEPTENDDTQWYAIDVEVEEPYQRKGIASHMYNIAKRAAQSQGKIIVRSHAQTDAGRGLWQDKKVWEEINPDIRNPEFKHEQQIGDYLYTAKTQPSQSGYFTYLLIRCYDGSKLIGKVNFEVRILAGKKWLESQMTEVDGNYKNKGIASTMYAYAKMLGNDVKPSPYQSDDGKAMWKAWKKSGSAQHLMKEDGSNSTTLAQLYNGNYPDRDETFWDYVNSSELETPLNIQTLPRHKVLLTLLGQYRVEHIDDIMDMLDDDRKELVQSYVNDPNLSSKVIVLSGHRIIDGNHRALAAAVKGVPINYVDLADLEEIDEDTGIGFRWTGNEKYRKLV